MDVLSPFIPVRCHSDWLTSTGSPVHVLMLSIQAVRGLPRLRASGVVPCVISFSRHSCERRLTRRPSCGVLAAEMTAMWTCSYPRLHCSVVTWRSPAGRRWSPTNSTRVGVCRRSTANSCSSVRHSHESATRSPLCDSERKCADTIGTVLVPWAGHFQC